MTIWRMRISLCKATNNMLAECNTYCYCAAMFFCTNTPIVTLNMHYLPSVATN